MAVDVNTDKFDFGDPQKLFQAPVLPNPVSGGGDISADGKRFLFLIPRDSLSAPSPFIVILNWQAGIQ